jgi:hypothetical protein
MRRIAKLLTVVPVALAFAACDSADQMTSPEYRAQTPTPVVTAPALASATHGTLQHIDGTSLDAVKGASTAAIGVNYIGTEGGSVDVWGFTGLVARLIVPKGAVTQSALFTVMVNGHGAVNVTATARTMNDVGSAGFLKPVRIYFNPKVNTSSRTAAGLRATTTTSTDGAFLNAAPKQGGTGGTYNDPNNPPPGDGWVWVDMDGFSGWIIIE